MTRKLIIFDLDGVLVDSHNVAGEYFLNLHPGLTQEIQREMLCGNFHVELQKMKEMYKPLDQTPEEMVQRKAAYSERKVLCPLFEGILDLLTKLHGEGHILAINTSALSPNSLPLLKKLGILDLFDTVATGDVIKSKVEKFKILEEKYKMPKENIIFITDTLGDVREADLAGILTIAVTYGAHERSYFEREEHKNLVAIVDTVKELGKELMK